MTKSRYIPTASTHLNKTEPLKVQAECPVSPISGEKMKLTTIGGGDEPQIPVWVSMKDRIIYPVKDTK